MNIHKDSVPPQWPLKFLRWFCPTEFYETIEGDLIEQFEIDYDESGEKRARRYFLLNVFKFFRSEILLRNKSKAFMNRDLILNSLKLGFLQFRKAPGFSFIHTFGTSLGLMAVLVIYLYLQFEISFDDFHPTPDNIYRINLVVEKDGSAISQSARTPPAFGGLAKNSPEIKRLSRSVVLGEVIVSNDTNNIRERRILMTDPAHFNLFQYQILKGNSVTMLAEPLSVVLSRNISSKLFGKADPIGRVVKINSENFDGIVEFTVKGVFENQKENSHLRPEVLVSYSTLHHFIGPEIDQSWDWQNLYTYVLLTNNTKIKLIEHNLTDEVNRQFGQAVSKKQEKWIVNLQPVKSIHTTTSLTGEFESGVSMINLISLGGVGTFVLLVILTNSINLTISRSVNRIKEVGMRKVVGALRIQLIIQFLIEVFLIQFVSVIMAILFVVLLYPQLIYNLDLPVLSNLGLLQVLQIPVIYYLVISTLLSGLYPAFVLSGRPISNALRGINKITDAGLGIRKTLLAVQFSISIAMIVGTVIVWQQLKFMNTFDLGINMTNKMVLRSGGVRDDNGNRRVKIFRDRLKNIATVKRIASLNEIPGNEIYWRSENYSRKSVKPGAVFSWLTVGDHYFELLGIPVEKGRTFDSEMDSYKFSVILNETAIRAFGFSDANEAIGAKLELGNQEVEIVGIAKDFHQQGLNKKIDPTIFRYSKDALNYYLIEFSSVYSKNDLLQVEKLFKFTFPDLPYEFFFLDEHFNKQYQSETLFSKAGVTISIFALLLAAIGLAGLSFQTISQRTKELGIRKILGANSRSLAFLLSKEYLTMVVMAGMVSLPFSYAIYSEWLSRFAFKITLSVWMFVIPLLIIFSISVISIGLQVIRASVANPVNSLKCE